jgi:hypothetical protein
MTPKEKADELVKKYRQHVNSLCPIHEGTVPFEHDEWDEQNERVILTNAKQCALIAVDEIISNDDPIRYYKTNKGDLPYNGSLITIGNYWNHVKEEIQKL